MKLVIERSKWYRGKGNQYSRLLVTETSVPEDIGKMCCLGFCAIAMGVPQDWLEDVGLPIPLFGRIEGVPKWFVNRTHTDLHEFTNANDKIGTPEEEREATITELFARRGIEVTFVD